MTHCPFCRILAGELPSSPVFDGELVVAILDIRPASPGHTLVMPRRHVESFTELSSTEVEQLALCGQRIATALKQRLDECEAVTFSLADGAAAGQASGRLQDRETLDAVASRLRMALAGS